MVALARERNLLRVSLTSQLSIRADLLARPSCKFRSFGCVPKPAPDAVLRDWLGRRNFLHHSRCSYIFAT